MWLKSSPNVVRSVTGFFQKPSTLRYEVNAINSHNILGMRVDGTSYEAATRQVIDWSARPEGRYVCVANVHMVMECYDDASLQTLVNSADMVTPDGMPLVWTLGALGTPDPSRVYGPTLTLHLCEAAAKAGVPVGFYGGKEEVLATLVSNLKTKYPDLDIAYHYSPPFRPLSEEEDAQIVEDINASGARILFVGLGCPRQERWMAAHQSKLPLVSLGVGAAFDFHAGSVKQAPSWLQKAGLEWLFRFAMEPGRLWKRYLKHNPRFIYLVGKQLFQRRYRKVKA